MLVRKAFRTSTCSNCRVSLLRAFTLDSSSHTPPWLLPPPKSISRITYKQTRNLSSATNPPLSDNDLAKAVVEDELDDNNDLAELEVTENIPWYLQVETAKKAPEFLLERQRIPDLPENPPPILEMLLQQLSIDLGLDYLTIIDLRELEPPPALGANLLMIIGTARSEKHLHTSADRLCRWLRSTHKLTPDADGLLGRDERKLKMKRKARRAKLLGSGMDDNGDDGIRTGWICVDVGVVEKAPEATVEKAAAEDTNFVGFGQRSDGIKVVIQMLTEEKREEIDLESLWNGLLKRSKDPELQQQQPQQQVLEDVMAEDMLTPR